MSTTDQPPKPKRRWYQFSLRTLLVVMLLSCFVFAWIGWRMQRARVNRVRVAPVEEAVAAIEKLGGTVTSEYEELRPQTWLEKQFDDPGDADDPVGVLKVTGVVCSGATFTDAGLEHLKGMADLQSLNAAHTEITDAGLEHLKGLTTLESLDLYRTEITDAGLEHLKGLTKLERLHLYDTKVTDAGLEHLKGLTKLKYLNLWGTNVTDAGLKHLKGLTQLERLYLADTKVTGAGLDHLKGLTKLKFLNLEGNHITHQGVKKFQQALPNCEISH